DFIFRILGMEYLGRTDLVHVQPSALDLRSDGTTPDGQLPAPMSAGVTTLPAAPATVATAPAPHVEPEKAPAHNHVHDAMDEQLAEMMGDAPVCDVCGHLTVRNGTCYRCLNCGNSMGCS
ncbi:MAG TPA: vitamin B12-dependent ribonucleotide reductase, partial [bacterium]